MTTLPAIIVPLLIVGIASWIQAPTDARTGAAILTDCSTRGAPMTWLNILTCWLIFNEITLIALMVRGEYHSSFAAYFRRYAPV